MKYILCSFLSLTTFLILLTIFGPWDTYRTPGRHDMLGGVEYVGDMPVWLGEIRRYTSGSRTEKEVFTEEAQMLEKEIARYKAELLTAENDSKRHLLETLIQWDEEYLDRIRPFCSDTSCKPASPD